MTDRRDKDKLAEMKRADQGQHGTANLGGTRFQLPEQYDEFLSHVQAMISNDGTGIITLQQTGVLPASNSGETSQEEEPGSRPRSKTKPPSITRSDSRNSRDYEDNGDDYGNGNGNGNGGGSSGGGNGGNGNGGGESRLPIDVRLVRTGADRTTDEALWEVIQDRTNAINYKNYEHFLDGLMYLTANESPDHPIEKAAYSAFRKAGASQLRGRYAYNVLRYATELFLLQECGLLSDAHLLTLKKGESDWPIDTERDQLASKLRKDYMVQLALEYQNAALPYMNLMYQELGEIPLKPWIGIGAGAETYGILPSRVASPCLIELLWTYWHEETGLFRALKAICLRFQNRRSRLGKNVLERMNLDPLRPLNNLLWGYIQDESRRLSLTRRNYEYDHHYGIRIRGKAVQPVRSVDSRSEFMRAFHTLLHLCSKFYREENDATIYADGFPVLNALKELHLLLAQGAANQWGDLPSVSRAESMMALWLLARPELREFLSSQTAVPYEERWMGRLDTMRAMQGWGKTSVSHYRDLAVTGEQILLSVRFGNWSNVHVSDNAERWAKFFRPAIQTYVHAYRTVTGVDLSSDRVDYHMPSVHLARAAR